MNDPMNYDDMQRLIEGYRHALNAAERNATQHEVAAKECRLIADGLRASIHDTLPMEPDATVHDTGCPLCDAFVRSLALDPNA